MTSIKTKKEEEKAANRNPFVEANLCRDLEASTYDFRGGRLNVWGDRNIPSVAKPSSTASKPKVRFMLERKDGGIGRPGHLK